MCGIALHTASEFHITPLQSLILTEQAYTSPRKEKEAMTESRSIEKEIRLRIVILKRKLVKSIPAARNNEIRGEIQGLEWVLQKL